MTETQEAPVRVTTEVAPTRPSITSLELAGLVLTGVVGAVAWASFTLAHLGHHSLPLVALASLVLVAPGVVVVRRVRVRHDLRATLVALGCAAVALVLTYPGFSYGVADKDPGIYVQTAISIARTGDVTIHDELLARNAKDPSFPVRIDSPGARLPGMWMQGSSGEIRPQFYHLWPSLLATTYDLAGVRGIRATTPLLGALAVLVLCALLRRVGDLLEPRAGWVVAAVGGLLLATNMMQVWQAKYPTTEVLSQLLFLTTLLGLVLALQTRWGPAAGLAGLAIGWGWLNRPDGVLLVLLAVALGAAVLTFGRWDRRALWCAAGVAVVVPQAVWQAYGYAEVYSDKNSVPSLGKVTGLAVGAFAVALVLRLWVTRLADGVHDLLLRRRAQLVLGAITVLGVAGLIGLGFLRPRLFGADSFQYNEQVLRSYDEQSLRRLSWFITLPAFALLPVGVALVALRRWRAALWVVVLPTLLVAPVYLYSSRNSPRMMWWVRRYVPMVLPGLVVLLALVLGLALLHRRKVLVRIPAALAATALVAVFLHQSLPLRRHDEFAGAFTVSQRLAALSHGRQGIYVWELDSTSFTDASQLFPTTLWLEHGEISTLLGDPHAAPLPAPMLDAYRAAFPDKPLFVLTGQGRLPEGVDPSRVHPVADLRASLPVWDESNDVRPELAHQLPVQILVWQVDR